MGEVSVIITVRHKTGHHARRYLTCSGSEWLTELALHLRYFQDAGLEVLDVLAWPYSRLIRANSVPDPSQWTWNRSVFGPLSLHN